MKHLTFGILCISSTLIYSAPRKRNAGTQEPQPQIVYVHVPVQQDPADAKKENNRELIMSALAAVTNAANMAINHENKPAVKQEAGKLLDNITHLVGTIMQRGSTPDPELRELIDLLLQEYARLQKAFGLSGHRR